MLQIKTGKSALKIFEKYGDALAAGKIEKNLGNIVARFGKESEAEKYYLAARRRFAEIGDKIELTMSENSLANTYAELNDFHKAEFFYKQALKNARREKMRVAEAEIKASMGNLALFRGKFDEALRLLELSRRKYENLKMPHQTAIAQLEIADIYLELNLTDEAQTIYEKVSDELMKDFYANLQRGAGVSASLRKAQLNIINEDVHPYFWSPFALIGK